MKKVLILALFAVTAAAMADPFTVNGAGFAIPDNDTAVGGSSSGTWGGSGGAITSIDSVTLTGISHTFIGDLRVWLEHNGQIFTLFQRPGTGTFGLGADLNGTYTFDLVSAQTLEQGGAGATVTPGNYRAAHQTNELNLTPGNNTVMSDGTVFNGGSVLGAWTLHITDGAATDTGSLGQGWSATGTYSTVPEPASMAALGLGALALIRRRRNKK